MTPVEANLRPVPTGKETITEQKRLFVRASLFLAFFKNRKVFVVAFIGDPWKTRIGVDEFRPVFVYLALAVWFLMGPPFTVTL